MFFRFSPTLSLYPVEVKEGPERRFLGDAPSGWSSLGTYPSIEFTVSATSGVLWSVLGWTLASWGLLGGALASWYLLSQALTSWSFLSCVQVCWNP